jgi:hypothetical protein
MKERGVALEGRRDSFSPPRVSAAGQVVQRDSELVRAALLRVLKAAARLRVVESHRRSLLFEAGAATASLTAAARHGRV